MGWILGFRMTKVLGALLLMGSVIGCGEGGPAAPAPTVAPGYAGPVPSGELQGELKSLSEKTFRDSQGGLGKGEWTVVSGFAVAPHPAAAGWIKEPHATVVRRGVDPARATADDRRYARLDSDDEARAFIGLVRQNPVETGELAPDATPPNAPSPPGG